MEDRNAVDREVGERLGVVLETAVGRDVGIVRGDDSTRAKCRLDQARSSGTSATSTAAGTACTGACRTGSKAADSGTGSVLYDARIDASEDAAGLRA